MKKSILNLIMIVLVMFFMGCLLEKDEECLDSGNCDTSQVDENQETGELDQTDEKDQTDKDDETDVTDQEDDKDEVEDKDPVICTADYAPVCGDGKTYSNQCGAEADGATNIVQGACEVVDPVVCIQIYAPVCGDDGKTYSNECYADAAGVENFTTGQCSEEINQCPVFIRSPIDMECPQGEAPVAVYDDNGCLIDGKCQVTDVAVCPAIMAVMPICELGEVAVPSLNENGCTTGYECKSLDSCLTREQYAPSGNDPYCSDIYSEKGCYEVSMCQ